MQVVVSRAGFELLENVNVCEGVYSPTTDIATLVHLHQLRNAGLVEINEPDLTVTITALGKAVAQAGAPMRHLALIPVQIDELDKHATGENRCQRS
jgi:hypothetical protein